MSDRNRDSAQQEEFRNMLNSIPDKKHKFDDKILLIGLALAVLIMIIAGLKNNININIENNPIQTSAFTPKRMWDRLSENEKKQAVIEAYARFPEILQYRERGKFDNLNKWLLEKGIIHPNVRDMFREYEDHMISWEGKEINDMPGVYATLIFRAGEVKSWIENPDTPPNNLSSWKKDVRRYADYSIDSARVSDIILDRF